MDIEPDTKDWTWVLARPCPECGLAAGDVAPTEVADRVRADLPRWEDVLRRPGARERPASTTWSPSEYACHVRDVFVLFEQRVRLMLDEDDPMFANWDQDETAIDSDYASQLPSDVAPQQRLDVHGRDARAVLPARRRPSPARRAGLRSLSTAGCCSARGTA